MANEKLFLSVIIPAYNEEIHIEPTVKEVLDYLNNKKYTFELLIVDDGSTDNTPYILKNRIAPLSNKIKLFTNQTNQGKGFSVRFAMLQAKGKYRLFMDADNSTSIVELDKILPHLLRGYDIVIGSRRDKEAVIKKRQPFYRIIPGQVYIFLANLLFSVNIRDYNCGFKGYKEEVAKKLFSKQIMDDWSFDAELIFLARKYGFKIKTVPVVWVNKPASKVKLIKDSFKSFLNLLRIRRNDLMGLYE